MKKFEYKILTISVEHFRKKDFQLELNEKFGRWGEEGWELVKMEPIAKAALLLQGASTTNFLVVFKRDKIETL